MERIPPKLLEARMEAFMEAARRSGLRVTHQRIEIYRAVASMQTHPDADAVYQEVKKRIPTIALDTVYRNLKRLAEHGLVSIVGLSHESLRFDGNMDVHDHFVCTQCGMIRDFKSGQLAELSLPREARKFGKPQSVHLEVKGVCKACSG